MARWRGLLVLAAIGALMAACLLWMRRLTLPAPSPRFLADRDRTSAGQSVPAEVSLR